MLRLLAACSFLGLKLAACSGGSAPETAPAAPPAPAAPVPPAPSLRAWTGTWAYHDEFDSGTLTIRSRPGDTEGFDFELQGLSGAHTGELSGRARLKKNVSRYSADNPEEGPCQLIFRLTEDSTLTVEQPKGTCGAGAGVSFAGEYRRETGRGAAAAKPKETTMLSRGIFRTPSEDAAFRQLVGADYRRFTESAQLVSEDTDSEFLGATVYESSVRGLGSVEGNMVIIDKDKHIWAAVLAGDSVLYYTNRPDYLTRLPGAIDKWQSYAQEEPRTVVYMSQPK
ncbi:hypothetical protein EJV47_14840 [Hymenobacter gummosus]|uniref:Lipocalin-like domain-containing protein n=1 Tax=Hymenobacter gummosus TaxID=1776032 RepID=A0A3S0K4F9_9BACT|nr:hypothetical protein [Hymenobacter gummosus]RTQ48871.1 hypothetical protein EJV47_14840 [Hymenobacter gummosus]